MNSGALEGHDMTTIRPLHGSPSPSLTEMTRSRVPYGHVISMMQRTGFYAWNFLIIRATSYGGEHDQRWKTFLSTMRADAEAAITSDPLGRPKDEAIIGLMMPLLSWAVLEDQDKFERASVEGAKHAFVEWRRGTARVLTIYSSIWTLWPDCPIPVLCHG